MPIRNALLISLDTTRAQSLSLYGHTHLTSPHLDRYAAGGVVFERCLSPHIPTHPGHTTLFSGKDVFAHQIATQGGKWDLAPSVRLLPEILREQGFFTAAADNLGRWFSRGFEVYQGYHWEVTPEGARKAEAVQRTALAVLEQALEQERPWFLFLHYWDPHTPYKPPKPFDRLFYAGDECDPSTKSLEPVFACEPFTLYFQQWMKSVDSSGQERPWTDIRFVNAQYDGAIAYMDAVLANLFTALRESGAEEETLVVVTADHGEELDEHALWYDHHGLYETNLWVPLILRAPGFLPAGQRRGGLVSLMDIAPTILDALGLGEEAQKEGMQGRSLLPLIAAQSDEGTLQHVYLTECTWMKKRGWRTAEWKLILETGETPEVYGKPEVELYHLPTDPGEQHNLAQERPEVVEALRQEMEAWIARRKEETGQPDPFDYQTITLRKIGSLKTAVPANQRLDKEEEG